MTAENVFDIAIHLPEKEMQRLLDMLNKNRNVALSKSVKTPKITNQEAIAYLLKNVFSKRAGNCS